MLEGREGSKKPRLGIYIIDNSVAISITKRTGDYEIKHGFDIYDTVN